MRSHPRFAARSRRTVPQQQAREAERRQARRPCPHHRMRARALRPLSPPPFTGGRLGGGALASRRSTAALAKAFTPWLSPDRASCAPDRCLVGLPGPQCSELLADRSSCRTGGVLGRPGAGLRAPRASAALAPSNGRHRLTSLTEQDFVKSSVKRDDCQGASSRYLRPDEGDCRQATVSGRNAYSENKK